MVSDQLDKHHWRGFLADLAQVISRSEYLDDDIVNVAKQLQGLCFLFLIFIMLIYSFVSVTS